MMSCSSKQLHTFWISLARPMFNSTSNIFLKPLNRTETQKRITMTSAVPASDFDTTISLETPLQDYERLMNEGQSDDVVDNDELQDNYKKISRAAREAIWILLFGSDSVTKEDQANIAAFLTRVKEDACFHDPFTYNEWITGVRDELLKKQMLDFWREHMVAKELGPCWARDSDYFDDMEDPEPAEFYNRAECRAPFNKPKN